MVDESSGSTGIPTNWIRSRSERRSNKIMLQFALKKLLGNDPLFIVNAFALGPWATGINVSLAFADSSIMKSLGPDPVKISNTLAFFGQEYHYVIMGYPPFLKLLVDTAGVDWASYNISFIFGGESMSELMRDYLLARGIKRVYGSYGASDLELNMGSENDFTISLRKLLAANPRLAQRLVRYPGALPMIFQYNPLDFYIEANAAGEMLITLCRPGYIAPKIRYNIHDRGYVVRMPELKRILSEFDIDINSIGQPASDLPLLFHFGRADMTVAYFGSKITPADVQDAVFGVPALAENVSAFTMITYEDDDVNKQLAFSFELTPGSKLLDLYKNQCAEKFIQELKKTNQDFREAARIAGDNNVPEVIFHKHHTGPFADSDLRIKLKYITREVQSA
jgi:phenylacetate-CoA ligase